MNDWSVGKIAWSRRVIPDAACGRRIAVDCWSRSYVLDCSLCWRVLIVRSIDCFVVFVDSMLGCKRLALMLSDGAAPVLISETAPVLVGRTAPVGW